MLALVRRLAGTGLIALALAGCVSGNLAPAEGLPGANQTYFLIGIQPSEAKIMMFRGTVAGGRFDTIYGSLSVFGAQPDDGYVLGKIDSGQLLAITMIHLGGMFSPLLYQPCGQQVTPVFDTPAGKIVYLTDIRYMKGTTVVRPSYHADIDAARAYLRRSHPALADRLEQGQYRLLPTTFECQP